MRIPIRHKTNVCQLVRSVTTCYQQASKWISNFNKKHIELATRFSIPTDKLNHLLVIFIFIVFFFNQSPNWYNHWQVLQIPLNHHSLSTYRTLRHKTNVCQRVRSGVPTINRYPVGYRTSIKKAYRTVHQIPNTSWNFKSAFDYFYIHSFFSINPRFDTIIRKCYQDH